MYAEKLTWMMRVVLADDDPLKALYWLRRRMIKILSW
jgi:hypothetical protein